jgi:hypothetical protein
MQAGGTNPSSTPSQGVSFFKYVAVPALVLLSVAGFASVTRSWSVFASLPSSSSLGWGGAAFWAGLVSAPGYLQGWRVVSRRAQMAPAESVWVTSSIALGMASAIVGGLAALFTLVLGIASFVAAFCAAWLLVDLRTWVGGPSFRQDTFVLRLVGFVSIPVASYVTCGFALTRWGTMDRQILVTGIVAAASTVLLGVVTRGFRPVFPPISPGRLGQVLFFSALAVYPVLLATFVIMIALIPSSESNAFRNVTSSIVGGLLLPSAWTFPVAAAIAWWRMARPVVPQNVVRREM